MHTFTMHTVIQGPGMGKCRPGASRKAPRTQVSG